MLKLVRGFNKLVKRYDFQPFIRSKETLMSQSKHLRLEKRVSSCQNVARRHFIDCKAKDIKCPECRSLVSSVVFLS